ncbi:MAG: 2-amino-4-hydroxy-6-hydroxymethyldihydropteridine diphosphokinase [Cocleimonas sp.]|nr:2-amino-4-hydroxy-6-hydroxymethyldihydropteridine diphosphokinase [Cocleimonas sp.]
MSVSICYIGLGSNLGNPITYLNNAVEALQAHPQISALTVSRFYNSKPQGSQNQPDYLNAVVQCETALEAHDLLDVLQNIENNNHRERTGEHWGARTLDLDLLLYGNIIIESATLSVPHPWMCKRSFVLYPLRELSPHLVLPDGRTLEQCIANLSTDDLELMR